MKANYRHWALPLILSFIVIVIMAFGDTARENLQYIRLGDFTPNYRWLTGHFTHIGWRHTVLNIAGLLSIWIIYGKSLSLFKWSIFIPFCALTISLGFYLFSPTILYYVGLSGVLHGMLALGAGYNLFMYFSLKASPHPHENLPVEDLIVLTGLCAKLIYEFFIGGVPFTASLAGDSVVTQAHLYGAVIGLCFATTLDFKQRF